MTKAGDISLYYRIATRLRALRFRLPARQTLDDTKKKVAVICFSGSRGEGSMRKKSEELIDWIQVNSLKPLSKPRFAGYDPPWTLPFLRRNEVMIDVK